MIVEIPDDNSIIKWKRNDKDDWKSAEISDLIKAYEERPQGEWIKSKDGYTRCSLCGSRGSAIKARFCHHCGADMRGDRNES